MQLGPCGSSLSNRFAEMFRVLFQNPHIAGVVNVNYWPSPYPNHSTDPSFADNGARNAKWPNVIEDMRDARPWLKKEEGLGDGGAGLFVGICRGDCGYHGG